LVLASWELLVLQHSQEPEVSGGARVVIVIVPYRSTKMTAAPDATVVAAAPRVALNLTLASRRSAVWHWPLQLQAQPLLSLRGETRTILMIAAAGQDTADIQLPKPPMMLVIPPIATSVLPKLALLVPLWRGLSNVLAANLGSAMASALAANFVLACQSPLLVWGAPQSLASMNATRPTNKKI